VVLKLVIGNKNYSSWSLRAWLYLRESQLPFEEIRLPLFTERWQTEIHRYTPAGKVPVLLDDDQVVWDSLAIAEYVREKFPHAVGWPDELATRTHARCLVAEMHSGFFAIREELPQNLRMCQRRSRDDFSSTAQAEMQRVETMWQDCYRRYGGPWLCGNFSIADVMYAPVALRFVTYGIQMTAAAQQFVEAVLALDAVQHWMQEAAAEEEYLPAIDQVVPLSSV